VRRREFITLFGGAVVWPLAARAQQPDRLRRIGVLMGTAESDPDQKAMVSVFTRALEDLGWKEGANIRIDRRWAASDVAGLRTQASELARLGLGSPDGRAA
jgi:putative ABC transport system substrate-binding protein